MLELLKDIIWATGVFLMIIPFGIGITALIAWVVSKCLDKYLGETEE